MTIWYAMESVFPATPKWRTKPAAAVEAEIACHMKGMEKYETNGVSYDSETGRVTCSIWMHMGSSYQSEFDDAWVRLVKAMADFTNEQAVCCVSHIDNEEREWLIGPRLHVLLVERAWLDLRRNTLRRRRGEVGVAIKDARQSVAKGRRVVVVKYLAG